MIPPRPHRSPRRRLAFSLVELLVAMAVLALIMTLVFQTTDETTKIWRRTQGKIEQFQSARVAFDAMTRRISQATLNTYLEYYGRDGVTNNVTPAYYYRHSELHFVSGFAGDPAGVSVSPKDPVTKLAGADERAFPGHAVFFQAPLGFTGNRDYRALENLLTAVGYFVEYREAAAIPPFIKLFDPTRSESYRYCLTQYIQPTEFNRIYTEPWTPRDTSSWNKWFAGDVATSTNRQVLAENVILLVILPQLPQRERDGYGPGSVEGNIAPQYAYNSRAGGDNKYYDTASTLPSPFRSRQFHQLPPQLRVIMVAVDEESAERLSPTGDPGSPSPGGGPRASLFSPAGKANIFRDSKEIDNDLSLFAQHLASYSPKINFRVFDTVIPLQGAKWSPN
jgi:uncharacterized protein (TIGR02599 family)